MDILLGPTLQLANKWGKLNYEEIYVISSVVGPAHGGTCYMVGPPCR